jgi:hypothetical protein
MKGASFKAGAGMIQSAFLPVPVPVPAPVLELEPEPALEPEPEPPVPGLGAVLAPLALGHSPALSQGVIAVPQAYSRWNPPLTINWRRIACSICSGVNCTPCNGGKYIPGAGFCRVAVTWGKFGEA